MYIVFCDSVFNNKAVDLDYKEEMEAAVAAGFNVALFSFEELMNNNLAKAFRFIPKDVKNLQKCIYRGWMLKPEKYKVLYDSLLKRNLELINTPEKYTYCHYLPNSYEAIRHQTPKTKWIHLENKKPDYDRIKILLDDFGDTALIVKDFVKSEKHSWDEACFIPIASDKEHVKKVVSTFLALRGEHLNEGLVFRKFEKLSFLTKHSKSGMPLTKEYRLFFGNGEIIQELNYWDEGDYNDEKLELERFQKIGNNIKSNLFTMDIAQKENGEWIIIELGDGQVAGLPDNADIIEFYKNLYLNMN